MAFSTSASVLNPTYTVNDIIMGTELDATQPINDFPSTQLEYGSAIRDGAWGVLVALDGSKEYKLMAPTIHIGRKLNEMAHNMIDAMCKSM